MEQGNFEEFELDEVIEELISNTLTRIKRDRVRDIIARLNAMNYLTNLDVNFDLNDLEERLTDVMYEHEDDSTDALGDIVLSTFMDFTAECISDLGITLHEDSKLSDILDVLNSLYTVYTLDAVVIPEIINILADNTRDDVELLVDVLDDFTVMDTGRLFKVIEDVDNGTLDNLKEYLEYKLFLKNDDIDEEVKKNIEYLLKADTMFGSTSIVAKYVAGEEFDSLGDAKVALYKVLETLGENINLVPYEIAATLYLLNDEKEELSTLYSEEIDLVIISWIGEDQNKHNLVNNLVTEVITKLKFRS